MADIRDGDELDETEQQDADQVADAQDDKDGAEGGIAPDGAMMQVVSTSEGDWQQARATVPIVGIGASAGGLEAIEGFFKNMAVNSGMAFVLVQHSGPGREALLAELVSHFTAMSVLLPTNETVLEPDCVYIAPPNRDVLLQGRTLTLLEPKVMSGMRLPIDTFFRSLARELRERAMCIILSGTGSDGTQGLMAIKERGGMVMVQAPSSATHAGMPQSAIDTDLVDYILRPEEMPEQLMGYVQREFFTRKPPQPAERSTSTHLLQRIFALLQRQTGHDFSLYKPNTILRRVERRMMVNRLERLDDYVRLLEANPLEIDILFRELLIGVTNFFRDAPAFETLETQVIPQLFVNRARDEPIRVWVPGCSTGEEAYSLAILLREQMDRQSVEYDVQIFATDIDAQAVEKARTGVYLENIAADVSPERLRRFFIRENYTYQISRRIRDMVVFAIQSVIKDPPFSRLDLISCRNLLIYLRPELQKKVLGLFHYALKPEGYLFLGSSETLGELSSLFTIIDRKWAIFQCPMTTSTLFKPVEFLMPPDASTIPRTRAGMSDTLANMRNITDVALLKRYAPSCAVINEQGELFYTHGRTGLYLEPSVGETSTNILRMAREGLRLPLASALRKVLLTHQEVMYQGVQVKTNGDVQTINLILERLNERGLILVIFEHVLPPLRIESTDAQDSVMDERNVRIRQLEQELQATREYLQVTIEELEASNEEIKSANEELQSANEELQSTNEELETSKEELQSMHEEQMTINTELRSKIEQLSRANNDLKNLLASIEVGTVFLDQELCIVRFTPAARRVINLRDMDIGRPLSDLVINIQDTDLLERAHRVLDTLEPYAAEVQTRDGEWYWMRIVPYRTVENVIDGVIMTFSNITQQKEAQEQVPRLLQVAEKSTSMIMMADVHERIEYVNPQVVTVTGYTAKEIMGQRLGMFLADQAAREQYQQVWELVTAGQEWQGEFLHRKKNGELFWVTASFSPMRDTRGVSRHVVIVEEDITERKRAEDERKRMNHLLAALGTWHRMLAPPRELQPVLTEMCRLLVTVGGYYAAWVGLVGQAAALRVRPVAQFGYEEGYMGTLERIWGDGEQVESPLATVLRTGQPSILHAIQTDVADSSWREAARIQGYQAIMTLPVREQGRLLGVLQVHATRPDAFDQHEAEMLNVIADNLAYALVQMQGGTEGEAA